MSVDDFRCGGHHVEQALSAQLLLLCCTQFMYELVLFSG